MVRPKVIVIVKKIIAITLQITAIEQILLDPDSSNTDKYIGALNCSNLIQSNYAEIRILIDL